VRPQVAVPPEVSDQDAAQFLVSGPVLLVTGRHVWCMSQSTARSPRGALTTSMCAGQSSHRIWYAPRSRDTGPPCHACVWTAALQTAA